jgi:hypothetical protein
MNSWRVFQRFGSRLFSPSNSDYIRLKNGLNAELGEDPIDTKPPASLFATAFSLNAWACITFVLLIVLYGTWFQWAGKCEDEKVIWAMPESGLSLQVQFRLDKRVLFRR